MADSRPTTVTAHGDRSVAAGGDISGFVFTGDVYVGEYERLADARQYTDGLVAELDLAHFAGRQWLLDVVDEFLRSEDRGYFVLEADAGLGKTTFCAWLARSRGYPVHFVQIQGGADPASALKDLAAQLIDDQRLDEFAPGGVLPPALGSPNGFARLLAAAGARARHVGRPLVLVVDGLDGIPSRVGEMPLGLPANPPSGVYLVVSRRPGGQMLPIGAPRRYFTLLAWAEPNQPPVPNQQDMLDYLRRVADEPPLAGLLVSAGLSAEAFIGQLAAKCAGVWIYLRYVLEEMRRRRSVADLTTLPDTVWQYYAGTFARSRQEDPDQWQAALLPLLTTLGAAAEPVPFGALCALAGVQADDRWRQVLDGPWRPFLQVQGGSRDAEPRYAVYHASLREFLNGQLAEASLAHMTAELPLIRQLHQALQARHGQIADRYLSAWGGLDTDLPELGQPAAGHLDDGYGLRHLAAHLVSAARPGDLHRLLSCQWTPPAAGTDAEPRHVNTWYYVRDRIGDLAGYLQDVQLAWRAATMATRQELSGGGSDAGLGLEIRYALITASMVSLATTLPIELITTLTEHRLWPTDQALAYSRQLSDPAQRSAALAALQPMLAPEQLHPVMADALAAARQVTDEDSRAQALQALAARLPDDLLGEALADALQLSTESGRATALVALAPRLPEHVLGEALTAAREITSEDLQAPTLMALAPRLPDDLLGEALTAARQIAVDFRRCQALTALAPRLPADQRRQVWAEALAAARQIDDDYGRGLVLAELASKLPPSQQPEVEAEALAAARQVTDDPFDRARALAGVTTNSKLPTGQRQQMWAEALAAARQIGDQSRRALALTALASHASADPRQPVWSEALAAAQRITYQYGDAPGLTDFGRAQALVNLIPGMPDDLLVEALAFARRMTSTGMRGLALRELAPRLPPDQQRQVWGEALATVLSDTMEDHRASALVDLAAGLPDDLLTETLAAAREITDKDRRARALAALAPRLPPGQRQQVWAEALAATQQIIDGEDRVKMLAALAPRLPQGQQQVWARALAIAQQITDDTSLWRVLTHLAPQLPASLLAEALAATGHLIYLDHRVDVRLAIVGRLPDGRRQQVAAETLAMARQITSEYSRSQALADVAWSLPADQREQAWAEAVASAMQSADVMTLTNVAERLPDDQRRQQVGDATVALARLVTRTYSRISALDLVAPSIPADQRQAVWTEALASTGRITGEYFDGDYWRVIGLLTVAAHLPADQRRQAGVEALAVARQITAVDVRTQAFVALAGRLPEELLGEALAAAGQITVEDGRAQVLAALAGRLPEELLGEALAAAREITVEDGRAWVIRALAGRLPEELLGEALAAAREITVEDGRGQVLAALAGRLPEELLGEALTAACHIGDRYRRASALKVLAGPIAQRTTFEASILLQQALPALARHPRDELLADLGALLGQSLETVNGTQVASSTAEAVIAVGDWWP